MQRWQVDFTTCWMADTHRLSDSLAEWFTEQIAEILNENGQMSENHECVRERNELHCVKSMNEVRVWIHIDEGVENVNEMNQMSEKSDTNSPIKEPEKIKYKILNAGLNKIVGWVGCNTWHECNEWSDWDELHGLKSGGEWTKCKKHGK